MLARPRTPQNTLHQISPTLTSLHVLGFNLCVSKASFTFAKSPSAAALIKAASSCANNDGDGGAAAARSRRRGKRAAVRHRDVHHRHKGVVPAQDTASDKSIPHTMIARPLHVTALFECLMETRAASTSLQSCSRRHRKKACRGKDQPVVMQVTVE